MQIPTEKNTMWFPGSLFQRLRAPWGRFRRDVADHVSPGRLIKNNVHGGGPLVLGRWVGNNFEEFQGLAVGVWTRVNLPFMRN